MNVSFHTPASLPDDAAEFWAASSERQDPAGQFARSLSWLRLITQDAPDAARLAVLRGPDGACRAVLPLAIRQRACSVALLGRQWLRRSWVALNVVGGDLVGDAGGATELAGVWRELAAAFPQSDLVVFDHVCDVGRATDLLASARKSGVYTAHRLSRDVPHYRLRMPADLEHCLARRSKKSIARLRSKANALARACGASLAVVEVRTRADWAPYGEQVETLMNHAWQAELLGQTFRISDYNAAADAGYLRAFLLLCGERVVAVTVYYQGMGTLISAVLGYDRELARYSPGAILMLRTFESLYAHDTPSYLDFGEGDADYKKQWADEEICVQRIMLVRRRMVLQSWFALQRSCRAVTRGGRRLLRVLGIERRLVQRLKRG